MIPQVGYSYSHQSIRRGKLRPPIFFGGQADSLQMRLHKPLTQSWYGPFAGLELGFDPVSKFHAEVAYYYHFLSLDQRNRASLVFNVFSGTAPVNDLLSSSFIEQHMRVKNHASRGQRIQGRMNYAVTPHWKMGASASYLYFRTHNGHIRNRQTTQEVFPAILTQESSTRLPYVSYWHSFIVLIEGIFSF